MSKDFRKNESRIVKELSIIQEVIVILAGNKEYYDENMYSKLVYDYIVPTYMFHPNSYTGLTSQCVKPTPVKILSKWREDYRVVNSKNIYTEYTGKVYSNNYLFLTSELYLDDICKITSFLTQLRTKNIKVKDIKAKFKELKEEMYEKYSIQDYTYIKTTNTSYLNHTTNTTSTLESDDIPSELHSYIRVDNVSNSKQIKIINR